MKKLQCELCGDIDLVKQDGFFVCQSCGCKYTPEEARKMLVELEGPVQVSGVATVDDLIKNAETFMKFGETDKAMEVYKKVSAEYPGDCRAWLGLARIEAGATRPLQKYITPIGFMQYERMVREKELVIKKYMDRARTVAKSAEAGMVEEEAAAIFRIIEENINKAKESLEAERKKSSELKLSDITGIYTNKSKRFLFSIFEVEGRGIGEWSRFYKDRQGEYWSEYFLFKVEIKNGEIYLAWLERKKMEKNLLNSRSVVTKKYDALITRPAAEERKQLPPLPDGVTDHTAGFFPSALFQLKDYEKAPAPQREGGSIRDLFVGGIFK